MSDEERTDIGGGEAQDEAQALPTHGARPDEAQDAAPTADGLNTVGFYRRPNTDEGAVPASTVVVRLPATDNARAGYEAKGYAFEGYAPA